MSILWDKLVFLAQLALLTAHERANFGAVRIGCRDDLLAVASDVAAVAKADGAVVDGESVVRLLDAVPDSMESSMQRRPGPRPSARAGGDRRGNCSARCAAEVPCAVNKVGSTRSYAALRHHTAALM